MKYILILFIFAFLPLSFLSLALTDGASAPVILVSGLLFAIIMLFKKSPSPSNDGVSKNHRPSLSDNEELTVELTLRFVSILIQQHETKRRLQSSKERAHSLNQLLIENNVTASTSVKTKIALLGFNIANLIIKEPMFLKTFYRPLLSGEYESLEVIKELELFIFDNLVGTKVIEGSSEKFKGTSLANELDGMFEVFSETHSAHLKPKKKMRKFASASRNIITEITSSKYCSFCDERIKVNAKKCKHCGEWLNQN